MLLCGLWHGAGWQYIGFGVLMSSAIVIARLWDVNVPRETFLRRAVTFLGPAIMSWFLWVNWIVFRAVDWERCLAMFRKFLFLDWGGTKSLPQEWFLVYLGVGAVHVALGKRLYPKRLLQIPDWAFALAFGAAAAFVLAFMELNAKPFVYFQF
jgi:hypothetical protein